MARARAGAALGHVARSAGRAIERIVRRGAPMRPARERRTRGHSKRAKLFRARDGHHRRSNHHHRANEARLAIRARPDAAPSSTRATPGSLFVGAIAVFVVVATLIVDASFMVGFLRERAGRRELHRHHGSRRLHRHSEPPRAVAAPPATAPDDIAASTKHALRPMPRRPSTARPEQTPRRSSRPKKPDCTQPFQGDSAGAKSLNVGARPPNTFPGIRLASALRRASRALEEGTPADCAQMFVIDAKGVKIPKLHCL